MYKIELTGQARKDIKRLNPMMWERIKQALGKLAVHPQAGYKLLGKHSGEWSYPVGSYRIIYEILKKKVIVLVLAIGHRREIYR
ncbi:MAG: hypothetical protein COS84_07595 [Armatimonadetes bacterium CG07_land_8_20_14_0_80_40_9]|nr:MAG: hypothetical protein COS84_07595 [Armatimonadetes bacterium CG07_land_8_20_14_0_80_40_9]